MDHDARNEFPNEIRNEQDRASSGLARQGGNVPAIAELAREIPCKSRGSKDHEAYISRLLELQRKAHRTAEETETAKLLIVLIVDYEAKHFTIEKVSGVEVLRELMDANGLRQKDLADDLGESIVSLVLKEKRQLNRQQMEKLSRRFHVSPAVFF
jgi:HTH-type transcriptional regulator / antitoxin HigA